MKRCLFTYEPLKKGEKIYSLQGLHQLSKRLSGLDVFPHSRQEQLALARKLVGKMSLQGVQPKFSVKLSERNATFQEVENHGTYILKPQVTGDLQLPENEDLTMHLVKMAGLKVPWHGLIQCSDGSLSYVIKRFDRKGSNQKIPMEDFSQLIGVGRDTKYDVETEKIAETIEQFCTYPTLEYFKLLQMLVLAFLLGNEDLHLKNLSVLTFAGKVQLSPVYDFVNSTLVMTDPKDELALSLAGKKSGLSRKDFIDGFAVPTLFLPKAKVEKEIHRLLGLVKPWMEMIERSFLDSERKKEYKALLLQRAKRLGES